MPEGVEIGPPREIVTHVRNINRKLTLLIGTIHVALGLTVLPDTNTWQTVNGHKSTDLTGSSTWHDY